MSTVVSRNDVLRLHVADDGLVWYGSDNQFAVNSYMQPSGFFQDNPLGFDFADPRCIRVLGTHSNASLLVFLHTLRIAAPATFKKQKLMLGSPSLVPTANLRSEPTTVLQHLWQPSCTSVAPGMWHEMTQLDYCTYAMIDEMQKVGCDDRVPEVVQRIVTYHPVWPALAYIPFLDRDAVCRLLCDIVDPRWFQHPSRPHRHSRLHAYLGITPRNMNAYLTSAFPDRHFNRARNVIASWYNRKFTKGDRLGKGKFLWQAFSTGGDKASGLLRGTQRFVSFLQEFWLNAVRRAHPEAFFHPFLFFRDTEEAVVFARHLMDWKPV